ncbi:30S ribosomal protein S18 [Patescibacteria group bacterium]|nr:30S ribosomal protein S18 [Patescibacteria group bacterium]
MPIKRQPNTVCIFCQEGVDEVTFRDYEVLRKFISGQKKILPRKKTGSCSRHQRKISREIKRAREMGLLRYRGM